MGEYKVIAYPGEDELAAAIEAVASSGGYKTPPIMGAVAFVMAHMLGVEYAKVCIAAALPAFFHYFGLFIMVAWGLFALTALRFPA